jgi:hypothetical protein
LLARSTLTRLPGTVTPPTGRSSRSTARRAPVGGGEAARVAVVQQGGVHGAHQRPVRQQRGGLCGVLATQRSQQRHRRVRVLAAAAATGETPQRRRRRARALESPCRTSARTVGTASELRSACCRCGVEHHASSSASSACRTPSESDDCSTATKGAMSVIWKKQEQGGQTECRSEIAQNTPGPQTRQPIGHPTTEHEWPSQHTGRR